MKVSLRPLALVVALVGSFVAGLLSMCWLSQPVNEMLRRGTLMSTTASVSRNLVVLRFLRHGRNELAVNLLETELDSDVIGLGAAYRTAGAPERAQAHCEVILGAVRAYRSVYPHPAESPGEDQAIREALALAPGPRN